MAARTSVVLHSMQAREKIKTSQLINRLNAFALREPDPQTGEVVEMSPAQVKAAIALLKKTVPDLQVIEGNLDMTVRKHEDAIEQLE